MQELVKRLRALEKRLEKLDAQTEASMGDDYGLRVARGLVRGVTSVNKFGKAPSGIQTSLTDVWSRADSSATQQIWLAPTAARIHAIVSTSASDDGSPVGVGARTIQLYGLQTWDLAETSEVITLNGTTPVNTVNSYANTDAIIYGIYY